MSYFDIHESICALYNEHGIKYFNHFDYNLLYKTYMDIYGEKCFFTCFDFTTTLDANDSNEKRCNICKNKELFNRISNYIHYYSINSFLINKFSPRLYRINNIIHFSGRIPFCHNFVKTFCKYLDEASDYNHNKIILIMNSIGGAMITADLIVEHMSNYCKKPIHCYAYANCSSAALTIYLACDVRYMHINTVWLIHFPLYYNDYIGGNNHICDNICKDICTNTINFNILYLAKYYQQKLNIDITIIYALMKRNILRNSHQALKYRICNEIIY